MTRATRVDVGGSQTHLTATGDAGLSQQEATAENLAREQAGFTGNLAASSHTMLSLTRIVIAQNAAEQSASRVQTLSTALDATIADGGQPATAAELQLQAGYRATIRSALIRADFYRSRPDPSTQHNSSSSVWWVSSNRS